MANRRWWCILFIPLTCWVVWPGHPAGWAAEVQAVAASSSSLRLAYLHDPDRHAAANRAGRNYWSIYLREILDQLGLRGDQVSPALFQNAQQLARYSTILVGDLDTKHLTPAARANLESWVRGGGTLIAMGTAGLHDLCGNRHVGRLRQPADDFTCTATFALKAHPLTQDIHSVLHPQQRLLIFADVDKVQPRQAIELARLHDPRGQDTGCAAVTVRELGKGRACFFAFSVPQTMWVLHQGRPVDRDYDGDNMLRRSDAIVIRPHNIEVAYADELLFLLHNLIGTQPHPSLYPLPPIPVAKGGGIPDAVFHWGGDDEGDTLGIQLFASNWMKERGLPYHINAMPRKDGTFGLRLDDAHKILANGHEISLHYNFVDNYDLSAGFTRRDVLKQTDAFRKHFGSGFICSVNHWTRWVGWTEPAKWMREAGVKADNTFVHAGSPPSNPVNLLGFSFGTAFPFWFHDDWRDGNKKIDFLELPITAYECGYIGKDKTDFPLVHKIIDVAARYHLTMNMFHHPIYITRYPACRQAIEEGLRYAKERKIQTLHMGSDELYHWWQARSDARLSEGVMTGDELRFAVAANHATGVVIQVPLGKRRAAAVTINGAAAPVFKNEQRFGQNWALLVVPPGKATVKVTVN